MLTSANLLQTIFDSSPWFVKRAMINLEAMRRDKFRRYGDYAAELNFFNPTWHTSEPAVQEAFQLQQLNFLLQSAKTHVPYYREKLDSLEVKNLQDLQLIPILEKKHIRESPRSFVDERLKNKDLWLCKTSGSTGTPLNYFHDRAITRAHQAVADSLTDFFGCHFGERRARFSSVTMATSDQASPPYWLYIDWYKQLQCSTYHLSLNTCKDYLDALRNFKVAYGTGYTTAWHLLAMYIQDLGETPPPLKAIITDSEGITLEQQHFVEKVFGCPVLQTYGTSEVGQLVMQCKNKRYHVLTRSCIAEILDDHNQPVLPGNTGRVVVTDLTSLHTPFIRYATGDLATVSANACDCGWNTPIWSEIVGRTEDQIQLPDGRRISRLDHVSKHAIGVLESQIAQTAPDSIEIRVVPTHQFEAESMAVVLEAAHRFLGGSIKISWKQVDKLPRTRSGKFKYIVREIDQTQ